MKSAYIFYIMILLLNLIVLIQSESRKDVFARLKKDNENREKTESRSQKPYTDSQSSRSEPKNNILRIKDQKKNEKEANNSSSN